METIHHYVFEYASPTIEAYRTEPDKMLCVSYTVEIINGGVITEDEDPWETKQ